MEQKEPPNEENIDVGLTSVKSMFETGEIIKMYQLAKLYPTKIITALGLNHSRYIDKLTRPEKFSIGEVIRFCLLTGADYNKVLQVILKQAIPNIIELEDSKKKREFLEGKAPSRKESKSSEITSEAIKSPEIVNIPGSVLAKVKKTRSRKSK
jgi:hypothetical protein